MRTTIRLSLAAVTASGLLAPGVGATSEADIERCRQAGDEQSRIACLEAALRDAASRTRPPTAAIPAPPDAGSAAAPETDPPSPGDLGAEHVRTRTGEAEQRLRAQTVEIRFVARDKLWVKLDSGQIWRQLDSDRTDLSRRVRGASAFEVELWRSRFGGYRLAIPEIDRTIKVRRLR